MKKSTQLLFLILCVIFFNCSSGKENINVEEVNVENLNLQLPDLISLLEETQGKVKSLSKSLPGFDFYFTSESDMVSMDKGCFTVNVRVYFHDGITSQKTLVASENVKLGDCDEEQNKSTSKKYNDDCESFTLDNGDRFINNGIKTPYCMKQLMKYDIIKDLYTKSINKLIGKRGKSNI